MEDKFDTSDMNSPRPSKIIAPGTAAQVRKRVELGGERVWRLEDFRDLPFMAVAQALSRLTREGRIERLGKGLYYRSRTTSLGQSRPNPAVIQKLASGRKTVFPAGLAAANLLGFTTQTANRNEVATSALSLPRQLIGRDTRIHTRRPEAWKSLSQIDASLLDFLRRRGDSSELSPKATTRKLLNLLAEKGRFEQLLAVADSEPPRVRALLGAIGEQIRKPPRMLRALRAGLNPLSRFDFGILSTLKHALHWQAKRHTSGETV